MGGGDVVRYLIKCFTEQNEKFWVKVNEEVINVSGGNRSIIHLFIHSFIHLLCCLKHET